MIRQNKKFEKLIVYTDGGARGNPGPAGIGAVVYHEDKNIILEVSEFIGVATNNQAEYRAVISVLKKLRDFQIKELFFFLDSELVVRQLKREYKVKNKGLAELFIKIYNECISYKKVTFTHVKREFNKEADKLANEAMDRGV